MKRLWLTIMALGLAAGLAHAQVAAPTLTPIIPGDTTANPSTLAFGAPSHAGGAWMDVEQTADPADPANEGTGDGLFVQGRFVGDRFAFGAEYLDLTLDLGNVVVGEKTLDITQTGLALSGKLTDSLSAGIGRKKSEFSESQTGTTASSDETLVLGGVSWQVGEMLFLGAAYGTQTLDASGLLDSYDRKVLRYGIALRSAGNATMWHLEYYRADGKPYDVTEIGEEVDDYTTDAFVAEANWDGILLGYRYSTTDTQDTDSVTGVTTNDQEITGTTLSAGWVPTEGWSLIASLDSQERKDRPSGAIEKTEAMFLAAAYRY